MRSAEKERMAGNLVILIGAFVVAGLTEAIIAITGESKQGMPTMFALVWLGMYVMGPGLRAAKIWKFRRELEKGEYCLFKLNPGQSDFYQNFTHGNVYEIDGRSIRVVYTIPGTVSGHPHSHVVDINCIYPTWYLREIRRATGPFR